MTFYEWLLTITDRDNPIGDFARDAKSDSNFPQDVNSWEKLNDYLENHAHAVDRAIEAGHDAFVEYKQSWH